MPPLQILKRINAEIEARRRAGEGLPPPPKTAIAGPEYFGLNQPNVSRAMMMMMMMRPAIERWCVGGGSEGVGQMRQATGVAD